MFLVTLPAGKFPLPLGGEGGRIERICARSRIREKKSAARRKERACPTKGRRVLESLWRIEFHVPFSLPALFARRGTAFLGKCARVSVCVCVRACPRAEHRLVRDAGPMTGSGRVAWRETRRGDSATAKVTATESRAPDERAARRTTCEDDDDDDEHDVGRDE